MTTVTQDLLGPAYATAGESFSAVLKVFSDTTFAVQSLVVAVRDSAGNNLDFPDVNNVVITPAGYTLTTAKKSFTAGTYTTFGAYLLNGVWHNLPAVSMIIGAAS